MSSLNNVVIADFKPEYAPETDAIEDAEWAHISALELYERGFIMKVALVDSKVVGVSYGEKKGDLFVYETCIIDSRHRGEDIGTQLTENLIQHVKSLGCCNIVAKCLLSNGKLNAKGLMGKFEFTEVLRVKSYWKCQSLDGDPCRVCGKNPCECTCVFYLKRL